MELESKESKGAIMSNIRDFVDYEQVGDFVVLEHKTDSLTARVMCMRTGKFWEFEGETCLHDAQRHAFDNHCAVMYRK